MIKRLFNWLFPHRCSFDKPIVSRYRTMTSRDIVFECECGKRKSVKVYRSFDSHEFFPIGTSVNLSLDDYNKILNKEL